MNWIDVHWIYWAHWVSLSLSQQTQTQTQTPAQTQKPLVLADTVDGLSRMYRDLYPEYNMLFHKKEGARARMKELLDETDGEKDDE